MLSSNRLQELYDSTVHFFVIRSPSTYFAFRPVDSDDSSDTEEAGYKTPSSEIDSQIVEEVLDPIARLTRQCASLREQLEAARLHCCVGSRRHSPSHSHQYLPLRPVNSASSASPPMSDSPAQREIGRLEDRCKRLERALKETRDVLRTTESELDRARRDDISRPGSSQLRRRSEEASRPSSPFSSRPNQHPLIHRHSVLTRSAGEVMQLPADPISEERARRKSTEVFFTKTDSWSGKDVLQVRVIFVLTDKHIHTYL